jgi:hypothetical protein
MPRLTPCPSCHSHVLVDERECPHCGAGLRQVAGRGAAVLMGLALAGCPSAGEPEYGVPDTGPDDGTASSTATDTGLETGTGGMGTGTDTVGEPEYGVPETTGA